MRREKGLKIFMVGFVEDGDEREEDEEEKTEVA